MDVDGSRSKPVSPAGVSACLAVHVVTAMWADTRLVHRLRDGEQSCKPYVRVPEDVELPFPALGGAHAVVQSGSPGDTERWVHAR